MIDTLFDVRADFHVLAAPGCAELLDTGDVLAKSHATRAMNATRHVGRDQWAKVFVFDHTFSFVKPRQISAVAHRDILQFALASLIADWAIKRVIDQ